MHGQTETTARRDDEGFMLVAVIVMIFLMLLALSVAAPRIATQLRRDREVEATHRANQYVRAIQVYYRKFGRYPGTIEQLEKTNNQRFLRQKYVDPLTGKADWRIIHVGENKTKVKGLFGEDLPGLPGGLGAASGLSSGSNGSGSSSSAFSNGSGSNGSGLSNGSAGGASGGAMNAGRTPANSDGSTGAFGSSSGSSSGSSGGIGSTSATDFKGGGAIMGVGSNRAGDAIVVVNEQTSYQTWEFLYDPRIELLKQKGALQGGMQGGSGTSGQNGFGQSGFGQSGSGQ